MADLREKVEAELQNIDDALRDLPGANRLTGLSPLELAGTAALLSSFYNGLENILKQVALSRRLPIPTGATWHRDLLHLAVADGIISARMRDRLAPYLAFRHFFSHAYGFDLDPARLQPLVRDLAEVYKEFRSEIAQALPPLRRRK